jgi:hypothetical protein
MGNLAILYRDMEKIDLAEKWFLRSVAAGDPSHAIDLAKLQLRRTNKNAALLANQHLRVAAQGAANGLLCEADEEELEKLTIHVEQLLNSTQK